jgi:hypothetical protein
MELLHDNEAVLLDLGYKPGVKLAPRRVDFSLVFPNAGVRDSMQAKIIELGFEWEDSEEAVKPDTVEAYAFQKIQPDAVSITQAEYTLETEIKAVDGYVDGWGFFGDTEH